MKLRLKIALVSPYDHAYPGGVQEHVRHLARWLTHDGDEVRIIAPSSSATTALGVYRLGSVVGVPANGSVARVTFSWRVAQQLRQIFERERFDVVHVHEPLAPVLPLLALRHSRAVNVGTFHRGGGSDLIYRCGRIFLQGFVTRLHARLAVSPAAERFVAAHFPGRYQICPNGVDVERFSPAVPPLPELRDGYLNVLFVGRLEPRKGLRYLFEALALVRREVSKVRLLVAGPGDLQSYARLAARPGLDDVRFLGYVAPADLPRYYRSCDVLCAPATGGESFGIVLLEALASGIPVVASDLDGYRAVVAHERDGLLVQPRSPAALAAALVRLADEPALRADLGRNGRAKAETFAWPTITQRLRRHYVTAIQTGGSRGEPAPGSWTAAVLRGTA
ncbi:MAG: glycosyltransferase family 4 protein [Chloroflexi bacterium]|nr:glycosyltransferase family 4 protein [Chloroflexota bacterium]